MAQQFMQLREADGEVTCIHTHQLFNCTHICTTLSPLDLWKDPAGVTALLARWTEKLAGGPQAGTSDSPLSRVMAVGRQQQVTCMVFATQHWGSRLGGVDRFRK